MFAKKSLLKIFFCLQRRLLLNISEVWKKTKLSHLKLCKCFLVLLFRNSGKTVSKAKGFESATLRKNKLYYRANFTIVFYNCERLLLFSDISQLQ